MQDLEPRDRELLHSLQGEIPIASTPYAIIGQRIDMSEKEVIKRAERLKREGILRQISAVFNPRALGFASSLVAAEVDAENIDRSASVVNLHPGVTQNYRRNHDFNLWFSIAVPPDSKLGLQRTIELLAEEAAFRKTLVLPTIKSLKTNATMTDSGEIEEEEHSGQHEKLTEREIEIVRLLQRDLPLAPRPFEALTKGETVAADEVLSAAQQLRSRHQLRRISAVIQVRRPFMANAMGLWVVPDARAEETGRRMAKHQAVLQCYLRPPQDGWPYNIYTTVQGRSIDECDQVLAEIAAETGVFERTVLYPTKEYKHSRLTYFSDDVQGWEAPRLSRRAESAAS